MTLKAQELKYIFFLIDGGYGVISSAKRKYFSTRTQGWDKDNLHATAADQGDFFKELCRLI